MYKILISKDNKPYWIFVASNGKIIANSETFNSREACISGIRSSKNSLTMFHFEIYISTDSKYYFVQKANNYEILCKSEMYETKQMCLHGIEVMQNLCPSALIV
ncbi:YegP family protein [Aquirufa nivalisilvae]